MPVSRVETVEVERSGWGRPSFDVKVLAARDMAAMLLRGGGDMFTRKLLAITGAIVSLGCFSGAAQAHTTSLGFVPGANPGEVTFWTGSYFHGGIATNEGTLTVTGVDVTFGPTTQAFDMIVGGNSSPVGAAKPAGLVDGTNNFFWASSPDPSFTYEFPVNTDPNLFGGIRTWQGVTFAGLNPGTYDFTCGATCGTTQQWDSLSTAGSVKNLSGQGLGADTLRFTLTGSDIGGGGTNGTVTVAEPATLLLLAAGMLGLGLRERRSRMA